MSSQSHFSLTSRALCGIFLRRGVRPETIGRRTLSALVQLGVGVTQLDCDVPDLFFEMLHCVHCGDSAHEGTLSVGDVADRANVDGRLTGDYLGRHGRQCVHIQAFERLGSEVRLTHDDGQVLLDRLFLR